LPTPQEQADTFVEFLGAANRIPSEWVPCYPQRLGGILGTADDPTSQDIRGLTYILSRLTDQGLIEQPTETAQSTHDGAIFYRLTFDGWERFDELSRRSVDSHTAFMAMKFGKAVTDTLFTSYLKPAVKQAGFDVRRLDERPRPGLIDQNMEVELRLAKFVVAELSRKSRCLLGGRFRFRARKTGFLFV
jgi:hypothetical protein